MASSRFLNESSLSLLATSRTRNSFNNCSWNEIIELKRREAEVLAHQFHEMIEMNADSYQNETFLDFTRFIKDRSDHIKNLSAEIKDAMPVAYPKFFIEACDQLKCSLSRELEELQQMIDERKKDVAIVKNVFECTAVRIKCMEEVMDMAESRVEDEKTIEAIERKILDLKFKEAQKHLDFTLKYVFPNHHVAFAELLTKVCDDEEEEEDEQDRWIDFEDEDCTLFKVLSIANIIKENELDSTQFSLLRM